MTTYFGSPPMTEEECDNLSRKDAEEIVSKLNPNGTPKWGLYEAIGKYCRHRRSALGLKRGYVEEKLKLEPNALICLENGTLPSYMSNGFNFWYYLKRQLEETKDSRGSEILSQALKERRLILDNLLPV